MPEPTRYRHRPVLHWAVFLCLILFVGAGFAVFHPQTPLPPEWNPARPLRISDPITPLTTWKLTAALATREGCVATLATSAEFDLLPDFEKDAQCYIRPQVQVQKVGNAALTTIKTRCQTALRLAMWERHGIQPAAKRHLGNEVREITHFSSYSCRKIRTTGGRGERMSSHATADAIDVSGFVLADGRRLSLLENWNGAAADTAFMREVRDSACYWFRVTLSPDYNALHADHFHLQHSGFGLCR